MRQQFKTGAWILIGMAALWVLPANPAGAAPAAWYAAGDSGRSSLYQEGQTALDESRWADAARAFEKVAEQGGSDQDAALYWQAYALVKRGRDRQAMTVLSTLQGDHPTSKWIDDARALELEIRQTSGEEVSPSSLDDDELRLYAVSSLMNADSEKALPILEKILVGDYPPELKNRALFVLSQSDSPRSRTILLEMARSPSPELAEEAVEFLGLCDECGPELRELYAEADARVKRSVLDAMMLADDNQGILQAAENERDSELRLHAIELLGLVEATDDLERLYEKETSKEIKAEIIEALFLADDDTTLARIAREDADPDLRLEAIEALGLVDSSKSIQTLQSLYMSEQSDRVKEEIIGALFLSDAALALVQIAREDSNVSLRLEAIEALGLVDTSEAGRELESLYAESDDYEIREEIIEAFFLQDNSSALIDIFRTETDARLRRKALENLSLMDSEEAVDFLLEAIDG